MNRIEALNILGLDDDATAADIKTAYKECVQILHPDRFANNKKLQDRATEQFKRLQDAYEFLTSDKGSRSSGSRTSARSSGRAYSTVEAQLAGLAAARTQLVAQRDQLLDERRNALVLMVAGGIVAFVLRRIVWLAGLAGTLFIWGLVSFISTNQNLGSIDEHLKEMEIQRRQLEARLEEDDD